MEKDFSMLLGNEKTKARLVSSIKSSTLPHAFLITGKTGSGKKTLVNEIAMALNCERKTDALPCHICNTCRRIKDGNYTDIYTLRRSSSKASIGVEEVRDFKSQMMLSPVESDCKVCIIDDAERLTVQAQNALLTFLEEPPRSTFIFLLASSADAILTTIKSRAQAISMSKFDKSTLKEYVCLLSEKARSLRKTNEDVLDSIIMSADGVIGRVLAILSEGAEGEIASAAAITESITECICKNASYTELYKALSSLSTDRKKFISMLEGVLLSIRDIILCRFDDKSQPVFYSSSEKAIELSKKSNSKKLLKVYDILSKSIEDASSNVSVATLITSIATQIKLL